MNEKLKITKVKLWIMKREKCGEDKRTQGKMEGRNKIAHGRKKMKQNKKKILEKTWVTQGSK